MTVYVGTSGFSFPEWRGTFYPEGFPLDEMLGYYSERLSAVEINNTFYRMPGEKMLANWTAVVPETFRFALKAPRTITHIKRLKDAGDPTEHVLRTANALGARLGPLLFQLPPNLKKDLARLTDFLALLPAPVAGEPPVRAAFEFRHVSWFDEEVFAALSARGAALCLAEDDELETPFVPTAPWGYLRLRKTAYDDEALRAKAERVRGAGWRDGFVFFKHEEEGTGPRFAAAFRAALDS
jgi:uncharacterized protein YecE (DUF72 family)